MKVAKKAFLFWLLIVTFFFSSPLLLPAETFQFSVRDSQVEVLAPAQEKTNLCLTMIVKNEGRIIERCLSRVKDIVDCVSICDTGSTDNTVQIIEEFLQKNNIPGQVHHHKWQNFGHNRSLSANAAKQTLAELGFSLPHTYLLLLDADMLLEVGADFDKKVLKDDSYLLLQKNNSQSYYNTRLVRASLPWECVGVTHEYWGCKGPNKSSQLKTLYIDDRNDGGCKADKFERDIRLLTEGLIAEPNNERYMFYLAQSYMCNQQPDEAIKWYKNRIDKGGWKEEVWFSKFMIGECYENKKDWDNALHWYLEAYQYEPARAEPLQKIATHYRIDGKHQLAYLFAKQGKSIPYPKDHLLFITHPVYDYQFDEELSIVSYYTPFKEDGLIATNNLLLNKNVPQNIKEQAYKNLLFYVHNLKNAEFKPVLFDIPFIREGVSEKYKPLNPSILKTEEGYRVICRTVNYTQKGAVDYTSLDSTDPHFIARTKNFLLNYDKEFNLLSQNEIFEGLPRKRIRSVEIEGLEDCRLVDLNNQTWFSCTTCDTSPAGLRQISLCKLADKPVANMFMVEKLIPLNNPNGINRHEKNWLPFVKDNELVFVYSSYPFTLYKPNMETGICQKVLEYTSEHDFSRFSGSASPIEYKNGYLMLVHETVIKDEVRHYLHRFVFLDDNFKIKKTSLPFTFKHDGIEYACGMTIDHSNKKLIIGVGIEDREAYLVHVDLNTVKEMLHHSCSEIEDFDQSKALADTGSAFRNSNSTQGYKEQ